MKHSWLVLLLGSGVLLANGEYAAMNVNSRYIVESVEIAGGSESRISAGLRQEILRLIGEKLDPTSLNELARRIRRELRARAVTHRVLRGGRPDYVKVVFQAEGRPARFDVSVPKFLYHAKQGWSAAVEATGTIGNNSFTAGLVSDGDELPERYAGVLARYENKRLGSERVHMSFLLESYHQQWNRATLRAAENGPEGGAAIYRTRQNFKPAVTLVLAAPVTLTLGASFQRFQVQFPAAHTQAANAVITTLRYHRQVEASGVQQEISAGYSLRAATRLLASDHVYARHCWDAGYTVSRGKHKLRDEVSAGIISGRAPLFERYVLGNSSTLRGWNKFDLDPLGATRMAHNALEYRYGIFHVFYDTGAVWNTGQEPVLRHSVGLGLRQRGFMLALAFPVREGRAEPMFMVGMNY